MKNSFDKALNIKDTKKKKIYRYKDFSTKYIIFVPLLYLAAGELWIKNKIYSLRKWNEKRTNRIITECFPKFAEKNAEEGTLTAPFRFVCGHTNWVNRCKWKDIKYCRKFGREIQKYLLENFEMKGYTKTIENDNDSDWYWVTFTKNN